MATELAQWPGGVTAATGGDAQALEGASLLAAGRMEGQEDDPVELDKSNVLLFGPTGSGMHSRTHANK